MMGSSMDEQLRTLIRGSLNCADPIIVSTEEPGVNREEDEEYPVESVSDGNVSEADIDEALSNDFEEGTTEDDDDSPADTHPDRTGVQVQA